MQRPEPQTRAVSLRLHNLDLVPCIQMSALILEVFKMKKALRTQSEAFSWPHVAYGHLQILNADRLCLGGCQAPFLLATSCNMFLSQTQLPLPSSYRPSVTARNH